MKPSKTVNQLLQTFSSMNKSENHNSESGIDIYNKKEDWQVVECISVVYYFVYGNKLHQI